MSSSSTTRSDTTTTFTFPPPPLMNFLRTNFSKSRTSRSKSRRRMRQLMTGLEPPQAEPSSPKVTCIGQVRLRKTTSSRRRRFRVSKSSVLCCRWVVRVKGVMLCFSNYFHKLTCDTCRLLSKWVGCGAQGHDMSSEQNRTERRSSVGQGLLKSRSKVQPPFAAEERSLPVVPMNAFVLTRCRSASSSLELTKRRFWSSPTVSKPETETGDEENEDFKSHVREDINTLGMEQKQKDSTPESRSDRESLNLNENRVTVGLKRCKSEPGRVMEKLVSDPELDFRGRRKSEFDCVN